VRRSSPQEDYIWTLTGVRNLVEKQNKIMEEIRIQNKKSERKLNAESIENINSKVRDGFETKRDSKRQIYKSQNSVSFNTHNTSLIYSKNDMTRSSSSSMQTLRRILEIEEWRQFSERLDLKLETMIYL
jgi:hypothetical protein